LIKNIASDYSLSDYDGVFLDKIRFPSYANRSDALSCCFCDNCKTKYNIEGIRQYIRNYKPRDTLNPLGIVSYEKMRLVFEDEILNSFLSYRSDAVFSAVEQLCQFFRGKGLKIGLDLFAPFLSGFVGQDYARMLCLADMVKPMFYRRTNAPAGLPYEIERYASSYSDDAVTRKQIIGRFYNILGEDPLSVGWINRETAAIRGHILENNLKTKLYAGIELNYKPEIAPVTKEYLTENIENIQNTDGFVMSWDLNLADMEMIDHMLCVRA